jgi:hypothetical protein
MKTISKILTAAVVLLFANNSFAQSEHSTNGTATATIIIPITVAAKHDLQFGNIAIHATNSGTVTVPLSGNRTFSGGVTLPATQGDVAPAEFEVTGDADRTFIVTLPALAELSNLNNGGAKMNVTNFVCTYGITTVTTSTLSSSGKATFYVGARLNVTGGQEPGNYSGTFPVIVDYN